MSRIDDDDGTTENMNSYETGSDRDGAETLGHATERLYGRLHYPQVSLSSIPLPSSSSKPLYDPLRRRGILNWYRLVYYSIGDSDDDYDVHHDKQHNSVAFLSGSQTQAFRLLYEWWTAQYQHPALSAQSTSAIIQEAGGVDALRRELRYSGISGDHVTVSTINWDRLQRLLARRGDLSSGSGSGVAIHSKDSEQAVSKASLTYHNKALLLWRFEFCQMNTYEHRHFSYEATLHDLRIDRRRLHENAFVQATTISYYVASRIRKQHQDEEEQDVKACSKDKGGEDYLQAWPGYVDTWTGLPWFPCAALDTGYKVLTWLKDTERSVDNAPYYLWDVEARKTIRVQDLGYVPDYTAVSHTWGRWELKKTDRITVPGVPWKLPQVKCFDVRLIGDLLDQLPTLSTHVWFDLVCIPQDGGPIMVREIARQALIFQHALHAIAWINEINDITPTAVLMKWMCLSLQNFAVDSEEEEQRRTLVNRSWMDLADDSTGLMTLPFRDNTDQNLGTTRREQSLVPNHWSTSLWTLQEVCLRPDMWICDKYFEYLSLEEGVCLSIWGLVAICNAFYTTFSQVEVYRSLNQSVNRYPALWEVNTWLIMTGLDKLEHLSQIDILTLGDRRQCLGRRAEAIMSALGATTWYDLSKATATDSADDLVLGKYPLVFVKEICAQNPGDFFGRHIREKLTHELKIIKHTHPATPTLVDTPHLIEEHLGDIDAPSEISIDDEGSLLPFSRGDAFYSDVSSLDITWTTHLSVPSWQIALDGSVKISGACILSSPFLVQAIDSTKTKPAVIDAFIVGVSTDGARQLAPTGGLKAMSIHPPVDAHDFVRTRKWPAFMVVVSYRESTGLNSTPFFIRGVILRAKAGFNSLEPNQQTKSTSMVKVGSFVIVMEKGGFEMPRTAPTNWTVL